MFRIRTRPTVAAKAVRLPATLGVAVVFGLTLVITGVSSGFLSESENTVQEMGASVWVVRSGADGPFLGSSPFFRHRRPGRVEPAGVISAVPTVYTHRDVVKGNGVSDVNVFGAPTGNLGMPPPSQGRQPAASDQIMISTALKGYPIGSHLLLAGHRFTVVGLVENSARVGGNSERLPDPAGSPTRGVRRIGRCLGDRGSGDRGHRSPDWARDGYQCRRAPTCCAPWARHAPRSP